jgi:hypothetical protein
VKKVYKFEKACGRMGALSGLFLAEEAEVARTLGQVVHLGDVLGKHSDINVIVDAGVLKMVSDDPVVIAFVAEHLGGGIGINPVAYHLNYLRNTELEP